MGVPRLLIYESKGKYLEYYKKEYCRKGVVTFDGIRVYFKENRFYHAFYESSKRDGIKDTFSLTRAQRIGWIRATLENSNSSMFQGWDKQRKRYDPGRRVCVVYENFVVILEMRLKRDGRLKAMFITCYMADDSINKIKRSPGWSKEVCLDWLNKKGR